METAYAYDPELVPVIAVLPNLDISDIGAAREQMKLMRSQSPAFSPPASITIEKLAVPGPQGSPDVDIWIFAPKERESLAPGVLYIHGGGFVLGDVAGDAEWPAQIAAEIGATVVSVEYRLAPEHPFPAPADDCYAALCWMAKNTGVLRLDPSRLAIAGRSAGAGLAAGVALMARDRHGPELCFQLLEIPELDDQLVTPSMRAYTDTPMWNLDNAIKSWAYYLRSRGGSAVSEYAAPARAENLAGLPPTFVSVAEFDPLRDEGIAYAQRLAQAGIPTELHMYPGTFHGSVSRAPDAGISRRMKEDRLQALRCAIAGK